MSDCEYDAAYDVLKDIDISCASSSSSSSSMESSSESELDEDVIQLNPALEFSECRHFLVHDGQGFCSLAGLKPRWYKRDFREIAECPFISLLNRSKFQENDFDVLTMIEIEDVRLLVTALLKVNMDIAHREWFLKVDIPEVSDYWYGYNEDGRWISFEPTVEYKFCNLHAENQKRNGKLLCTVSDEEVTRSIVPFNRELMKDGGCVQYSDLFYYHDYFRMLKNVEPDAWSQKMYSACPLQLRANSEIQSPVRPDQTIASRLKSIPRSHAQP